MSDVLNRRKLISLTTRRENKDLYLSFYQLPYFMSVKHWFRGELMYWIVSRQESFSKKIITEKKDKGIYAL